MKQFLKTAGILAGVCFVAALLLSVTDRLTQKAIAETGQKKKDAARQTVLQAARYTTYAIPDSSEVTNFLLRYSERTGIRFVPCRSLVQSNYSEARDASGKLVGYVFDVRAPGGYGGNLDIIVGVRNSATGKLAVSDYLVIASQETPGLGKAVEISMHSAFTNPGRPQGLGLLDPRDRRLDCVSGATITSVAIKDATYAALRMAVVLEERNFVRLDIPEGEMAIVPYSQTYEPVNLPFNETVRECLDVRWYGQTSGYLLKIVLKDAETRKKYLALAGFTAIDGKLHGTRLYTMPLSTNGVFTRVPDFNEALFSATEAASLATNAGLGRLEKELAGSIAAGRAMLGKAGKLP